MSSRWEVEAALRLSDLPATARLAVFALLSYSHAQSAIIPAEHSPSLAALARVTGLHGATVKRQLNRLESAGWVTRKRPSIREARAGVRTQYKMSVPSSATTMGQDRTQVVHRVAHDAPGVGAPRATSRRIMRHSSYPEPAKPAAARARAREGSRGTQFVMATEGATEAEAEGVLKLIQAERNPRSLVGLVHRLARDGELQDWLARVRANGHQGDTDEAYRSGWPCHRCGTTQRADVETCRQCGEGRRGEST